VRDRLTGFARAAGAYVPDATALAVLMLVLLAALALLAGNSVATTADAFYRGLWGLLAFGMQATLLLVLSTILSGTPLFRNAIARLAALPRSATQVVLASVLVTATASYFYWGLGIALGPLVAVHFARAAEARGLRIDFPCLLAAQLAATSVWQYGFSSTPALMAATPGHHLEAQVGVLSFASTNWSTPALLLVATFPLALAALARLLMRGAVQPLSAFPGALAFLGESAAERAVAGVSAAGDARGFAAWCERTRVLPWLLVAGLGVWLWQHFVVQGASLDLNAMITALLVLVLLTTGSLARFAAGLQAAVPSCWQVLVLFQVYGAVAGLLQYTDLGTRLAAFMAELATPVTFAFWTAVSGTLVALFVPTSGGQWIIQGFVTVEAARAVGAPPELGLIALGIGDQVGNLVAPFWLVVIAGIARIDFRAIFGYALLYAALWFALGVALFTLVPL
jgi:short-chain fatty acids transporter